MSLNQNLVTALRIQATTFASSGARTNTSLNSAYVHLTSGAGLGIRISVQDAQPINRVRVFTDLTTGTRANVTMRCRIYNASATATQPGSTLLATASTATYPSADDRWVDFIFASPHTPAVGDIVWAVIDNTASVPATDFPGILTNINSLTMPNNTRIAGFSTVNGFSTAGTAQTKMNFMVQFGSKWYGQPVTQQTSVFVSNTLKRGIIVTPTTNLRISSIDSPISSATFTTIDIYESTQIPNNTPIFTYTLTALERLVGTRVISPMVTLFKGKTYYIVQDYSAAITTPSGGQIEDYASFPTDFDQIIDGMGACGGVQEATGGTSWNILNSFIPNIFLSLDDTTAQTITSAI